MVEQTNSIEQFNDSATANKYQIAGEIASKALDQIIESIGPGVAVKTLCELGDLFITSEVRKVYLKQKDMKKGIAFPTSIGINNMVGYYSPEDTEFKVSEGDIVNIELGVHIDGFPATVAYTVVVHDGDEPLSDVSNKRANVISAVAEASRAVLPLIKNGKTNADVSDTLKKIAKKYDCSLPFVEDPDIRTPGVVSYQMSKNVLDGQNDDDVDDIHKLILPRHHHSYEFEMRPTEFETNEVYSIDIVMSSGEGRLYPTEERVTIFRRNYDKKHQLKMKSSHEALRYFNGAFPQSCGNDMTSRMKLGVQECTRNGLLIPYAPFAEKPGEYVAQVKFTVIVRNKKPILISGRSSDPQIEKVKILTQDEKISILEGRLSREEISLGEATRALDKLGIKLENGRELKKTEPELLETIAEEGEENSDEHAVELESETEPKKNVEDSCQTSSV